MNKKIIILLIALVAILIASFVFLSRDVNNKLEGLSPTCVKEWEKAGRFCQEFSEDICKNHYYYSDTLEREINCYWVNDYFVGDICRAEGICE